MPERRRKRRFFDIFGFGEEDFLFGGEPTEGGSGYSMSVTYDEKGKPVVQVKTQGDTDTTKLRRDIEQQYPEAKIEGLEKKPLIRIIDEKEEENKSEAEKEKR
ncbi:MAG: hypothetical protein OEY39_04245 [Candidatus Bathyarchaeota archaeon]|nr:hypothetical protein [Candidatus Bathyarchaeota archaeon]MDH5623659.1 hypothetical protein [Candidatus Bathyarchaeota archaeon]MDH5635274.1 hypothetical protein [Candidatus Bathyarchaeota archaeon]MDH5701622.1 hypothetical protein [Candidatus Bathyarchaeota archaeon]